MSFLTINGVDVPVAAPGNFKMEPEELGAAGLTRAANMTARRSRLAVKQHATGKTTPVPQDQGFFLEQLLLGAGDHWNFDADLYSDKGNGPSAITGTVTSDATGPAGGPRFGAACAKFAAGAASLAYVTDPLSTGWTVMYWLFGSSWDHWIVTALPGGTVNKWKNGVLQATGLPGILAVNTATGTVTFSTSTGSPTYLDDLVVIPAVIPSAFVAGVEAFCSAQAWPLFTRLVCAGDFHPVSLVMEGSSIVASQLPGALTTWAINLRQLDFELLEV